VAEKNYSGMSLRASVYLSGSLSSYGVLRIVPINALIYSMVFPSQYLLCPATQLFCCSLTYLAIANWSMKMFLLKTKVISVINNMAFIF
jgi:hypothetical protein